MSELELWNELGEIYYKSGAYDKAIHACQNMMELDPRSGLPYSNLAAIYICQGRNAEAIPLLQRAIELLGETINKAFLWKKMGDAYQKLKDNGNAFACYRKALELNPQDESLQDNLSSVEQAAGTFISDTLDGSSKNDPSSSNPDSSGENLSREESNGTGKRGGACWVYEEDETRGDEVKETLERLEPNPVILGSRVLTNVDVEKDDSENFDPLAGCQINNHVPAEGSNLAIPDGIEEKIIDDIDEKVLPLNPLENVAGSSDTAPACLWLGIQHLRKGEYNRALQFLKTALNLYDPSESNYQEALCHYAIAQVETCLGKIDDAIQSYQSAANLAPENIFPWNKLGTLNCMLDRYEDAQAAFQEAIEHNPKDYASWNGLGDVYHKLGRYEDAIAAYQLGNTFDNQLAEEDVLRKFEKSIEANPQIWYEAGNIYFGAGEYQDAVSSYQKATEIDPSNRAFQTGLVRAERALENNNPDANMGKYEQATKTEHGPEAESNPSVSRVETESEAGYWVFDTDTRRRNMQHPTSHPLAQDLDIVMGSVKPLFGFRSRAEQASGGNQMLQGTSHDSANILVQLPPRAIGQIRLDESARLPVNQLNRETSSTLPGSKVLAPCPSSMRNIGKSLAERTHGPEDWAEKQPSLEPQSPKNDIAAYRRVTELNPQNDRAWDALGNKYESAGLHNEAITAFEQAIALDPQKEAYHYHLGIALAYLEQYDKAIQALQKVIALNPKYVLAHCALAGYYRRLGRETEAREHVSIARANMEYENEYNQACFESISGDVDRAIALLEIALEKQQIQPDLVRSDPDLDFIREDPRFKELLYKNSILSQ